jgi:ribosomal-protein-alanine N-acetyltransferase
MFNKELYLKSTDRIFLKNVSKKDINNIHEYASDPEVSFFIGWKLKNNIKETNSLVEKMISNQEKGTHQYASVVLKSTKKVIGNIMIFNYDEISNQAEIGYVFNKENWNKGYGTESLELLVDFAFDYLKIHKLVAKVVEVNVGSCKILEKNKFILEGKLRDHFRIEGKYYSGLLYGLINEKDQLNY